MKRAWTNSMGIHALQLLGAIVLLCAGVGAAAERQSKPVAVGDVVPNFKLTDVDDQTRELADYKGKVVILEWFNPQCPYVVDQYTKRALKTFGNELQQAGVVYLAINSAAPGNQGAGKEANVEARERFGIHFPILLDEDAKVGHMLDARFTPHMFIIDAKGVLRYSGAIDNAPLGKVNSTTYPPGKNKQRGEYVNYVQQAYDEIKAGEDVSTPKTKPYGTRVKY
jgi:peroxiredoxin